MASRKKSVRLVPIFLRAGAEKNARQKDDRDDRNNDERGMKVHGANSLSLRLPKTPNTLNALSS